MYQIICNRLGMNFRRRVFSYELNYNNLLRSFQRKNRHHQSNSSLFCRFSMNNHQRSYRRTHESDSNSQNSSNYGQFFLYGGLLAWFENSLGTKRPKLDDDEIKENIKLAIVAIEEKKYEEAFDILHAALRLTRHKKNDSAENYVLDMMANLYYQTDQYDEATRLFTELMRRLMSTGTKQNDPAMIEISLKLADIYARTGDFERAEAGYLFCVDMARQNVTKADQEYNKITLEFKYVKNLQEEFEGKDKFSDPYALYGMVLECYAQFLVTRNRAQESVDYINKSLELSQFVHGTGVHSIIMLNNYATLCLKYAQYELAEKYMKDAVLRAVYMPEMTRQMPGFYCNYAEMLWHLNRREEALDYARRAVQLAEENKDAESIQMARAYLRDLKADNTARPPRPTPSAKKATEHKT